MKEIIGNIIAWLLVAAFASPFFWDPLENVQWGDDPHEDEALRGEPGRSDA